MEMEVIQDRYNDRKTWIVKRYACGHYYMNQAINGKMYYKHFVRMSKKMIISIIAG